MIKNTDIDNIDIEHVVILDQDSSGDDYMKNLFFRWPEVIVMTVEGKYPTNIYLKTRVIEEIEKNNNLIIFCFGAESEKLNAVSKKKFRMSSFLLRDLCRYPWSQPTFQFDDERLVNLMKTLSLSVTELERLKLYNNRIDISNPDSIKWFHSLLKS